MVNKKMKKKSKSIRGLDSRTNGIRSMLKYFSKSKYSIRYLHPSKRINPFIRSVPGKYSVRTETHYDCITGRCIPIYRRSKIKPIHSFRANVSITSLSNNS